MAKRSVKTQKRPEAYEHDDQVLLRPEVGTQAQFRKRKPPRTYRYDSSLSPTLDWDGQNAARERGEALIKEIVDAPSLEQARAAAKELAKLSRPFLNWAGKAERLSFDVPTVPLFVHERLSTKAILETLTAHERDRQMELQLFGDPQLSLAQQLEAYEHTGGWVNRLILGDSLVVMNSLLEYEGLGGQVQMIYIDPPYGVKFGSNFQPFVRKREVKNNEDADMTREPEMVKAYRDTWELGLHSYLTYLRDRLLVARDLLAPSGSVFVQISDENVHHVRELMDDVFDAENFVASIGFVTTTSQTSREIGSVADTLLWYARDRTSVKYRQLFVEKEAKVRKGWGFEYVEAPNGDRRRLSPAELAGEAPVPEGRLYMLSDLTSQGATPSGTVPFEFNGKLYSPGSRNHWKTTKEGMSQLVAAGRIQESTNQIRYVRFFDDFSVQRLTNLWTDTTQPGYADEKRYVVQTLAKVVERCVHMTSDPGDLVLDPTCGSGTTAYVAEQLGRRWIAIDTSRVPLALTRQRLLTATFPYYELQDSQRGPAGGFIYKRRQNKKGEEVGGIIPHVTLKSLAHDEPPQEEVLVDRPDVDSKITRVTGPFVVEATIPTALNGDAAEVDNEANDTGSFGDRMLEVLRRNPVLQIGSNRSITLTNVRAPAKSLTIDAEAELDEKERLVALVFGPENAAVSERLVYESAREAHARNYEQLIVIGFAIEAGARDLVEKCGDLVGITAIYVQATPDLTMGDLLKTMRSSQIFSVTGLPDVTVKRLPPEEKRGSVRHQVELRGLDVFDPTTMAADHRAGSDVPAWLLDTDYNDLCFHVSQAFFPRTSAWENLKRALKGDFDDSIWEHLAGTTSAPFVAGDNRKIAVKVIDDRGNELMAVRDLIVSNG